LGQCRPLAALLVGAKSWIKIPKNIQNSNFTKTFKKHEKNKNRNIISQTNSVKYLCVVLDKKLTWQP